MIRTALLLTLFVGSCATPPPPADPAPQLGDIFKDPPGPGLPQGISFSSDGGRLAFRQRREGSKLNDLWSLDLATGRKKLLYRAEGEQALSAEEKSARERRRERGRGVGRFFWNPKAPHLLLPLSGDLFLLRDGELERVTETKAPELTPAWSPDGRAVAYVRQQNLYVRKIGADERKLTSAGKAKIRCGLAEFIAQEELGRHRGFWWSEDSQRLAYVHTDSTKVPEFFMHDFLHETGRTIPQEYPRAGDANATWKLGVVAAKGGNTVWMTVKGEYLARVAWFPDGALAVQTLDRAQKELTFHRCDPKTGESTVLFHERDPAWVQLHRDTRLLKDGRILWSSERSGRRHLYLFEKGEWKTLTSGDWDVRGGVSVDEDRGEVWFSAASKNARERHLQRVSLDGGAVTRVTKRPGWHATVVSPDHRYFVDAYSRAHIPPRVTLRRAAGDVVAELGAEPARDGVSAPRFLEIPGADGAPMHAMFMRTAVPGKRPVVMYVYGGPGSQSVADRWRGTRYLFHTRLVHAGFHVLVCDNRGCGGRGRDSTRSVARALCQLEVEDQAAGAAWLAERRDVDKSRIGIWGWSYGGTMALQCIVRKSETFAAAVAVAPVTDWRDYDTAYTERYMGTPKDNPDGYRDGSPISVADQLSRPLLLVHGFKDDNVHFRGAVAFLHKAQQAGRALDVDFYPRGAHGIGGNTEKRLLFERMERFFAASLGR